MTDPNATDLTPATDAAPDGDPFVAEVRATRAAIAREADYDLSRIVADLRRIEEEERARGRRIIPTGGTAPGAAA